MTLEHRKSEIVNQLFQANITVLVGRVAQLDEEVEQLKQRITELEKPKTEAAPQGV